MVDVEEELDPWASFRPSSRDVYFALAIAAFVIVAFAFGTTTEDGGREITHWSFVFGTAAALLLAFRRVQPGWTLIAIAVAIAAYVSTGGVGGPVGIPIWIGLYSVAAAGNRRRSVFVAVFAAITVSVLVFLLGPNDPTTLEQVAAIGLTFVPVLIGDAVRSRRALIAEADERVRLAESATEQEAERRVQDERVRIARELHDVVAHSIATINVQAGVAAHVMDAAPEAAKEALIEIKGASKMAMGELRAMLGVLRSTDDEDEPGPLRPSPDINDIDELVARFSTEATLEIIGVHAEPIHAAVGLAIYRIVQESLTNSLKHAVDARVQVTLTYRADDIDVRITDDGGSGARESDESGGLGLIGLEERARSVDGTFNARPRFDGGFEVHATVPYRPAESPVR